MIDDGWYSLNINRDASFPSPVNVPFSHVEKLDEADMDETSQLSSSDGEITVMPKDSELNFKLVSKNWAVNTKIMAESAAWYSPKEKK